MKENEAKTKGTSLSQIRFSTTLHFFLFQFLFFNENKMKIHSLVEKKTNKKREMAFQCATI